MEGALGAFVGQLAATPLASRVVVRGTGIFLNRGSPTARCPRAVLACLTPDQTERRLDGDNGHPLVLSRIELRIGTDPWRKRMFVATSHITAGAAEQFGL